MVATTKSRKTVAVRRLRRAQNYAMSESLEITEHVMPITAVAIAAGNG